MGLLWRLFAPKPSKKARRTVRKAANPVRTATRAVTPKPVKQLQRAAHPVGLTELQIENVAVTKLRGRSQQKRSRHTAWPSTEASPPSERNLDEQGRLVTARRDERPARIRDGVEIALLVGSDDLEVVGESYYQENLWRLMGPRWPDERIRHNIYAVLVAEDDNSHDANAVAVWMQGLKVDHLSRANARRYRPGLLGLQRRYGQPIALNGVIGGGIREDGPGRLGVFLRHDPTDFYL